MKTPNPFVIQDQERPGTFWIGPEGCAVRVQVRAARGPFEKTVLDGLDREQDALDLVVDELLRMAAQQARCRTLHGLGIHP